MAGLSDKTTDDAIKNISRTKRKQAAPTPSPFGARVNLLEQAGIDTPGVSLLSKSMQPPQPVPPRGLAARALETDTGARRGGETGGGRGDNLARTKAIRQSAEAARSADPFAPPPTAPTATKPSPQPPLRPLAKPGDYVWDARRPAPSEEVTGILRKSPADWSATDALKVMTSRRYASPTGSDAKAAHGGVARYFAAAYPGPHEPGGTPAPTLFDPEERKRLDREREAQRAAAYRADPAPSFEAERETPAAPTVSQPRTVATPIFEIGPPRPSVDGGVLPGPQDRAAWRHKNRQQKEDEVRSILQNIADHGGPHVAQSIENLRTVADFLIAQLNPINDASEMQREFARATRSMLRGDFVDAVDAFGWGGLALLGIFTPGKIGHARNLSKKAMGLLEKNKAGKAVLNESRKHSARFKMAKYMRNYHRAEKPEALTLDHLIPDAALTPKQRQQLGLALNRAKGEAAELHVRRQLQRAGFDLDAGLSERRFLVEADGAELTRYLDSISKGQIEVVGKVYVRPVKGNTKGLDIGWEVKADHGKLKKNQELADGVLNAKGKSSASAKGKHTINGVNYATVPVKAFDEDLLVAMFDKHLLNNNAWGRDLADVEKAEILANLREFRRSPQGRNLPLGVLTVIVAGAALQGDTGPQSAPSAIIGRGSNDH